MSLPEDVVRFVERSFSQVDRAEALVHNRSLVRVLDLDNPIPEDAT
jgi:hypothetical protein